ncbi:hypothetical protein D3C75_996520 [compost metagenome]
MGISRQGHAANRRILADIWAADGNFLPIHDRPRGPRKRLARRKHGERTWLAIVCAGSAEPGGASVQRLWIKYRDADCGLFASLTGGSIDRINGAGYLLDMTKGRADELAGIAQQEFRVGPGSGRFDEKRSRGWLMARRCRWPMAAFG